MQGDQYHPGFCRGFLNTLQPATGLESKDCAMDTTNLNSDVNMDTNELYVSFSQYNGSPSIRVPVSVSGKSRKVATEALIDSGATGILISRGFVKKHQIPTTPLPQHIPVRNIDRTTNSGGSITQACTLNLELEGIDGTHREDIKLYVTELGKESIILGTDWLRQHNPDIDWTHDTLTLSHCPPACQLSHPSLCVQVHHYQHPL